ncbi:MAG: glutamate--tRNA ligase, partial [Candidatus Scatosoma sp.]
NCSLQKTEGENRRKLSKRKDPEASLNFYREQGYPPMAVNTYLMTLLNSNFEEWALKHPGEPYTDFKFSVEKMGKSGALFDVAKLNDISKTYFAGVDEKQAYAFLKTWAEEFASEDEKAYFNDERYAERVLALIMGTGSKKRRKDFACAAQAVKLMAYFYGETPENTDAQRFDKQTVQSVLQSFLKTYDVSDDCAAWFEKVKNAAAENGFAADMKAYKAAPENYKGNVSDVAEMLRIAVTGRANTPDLWTIMQILGEEKTRRRIAGAAR